MESAERPRRAEGRRRAALYLAQLAWLEGWPADEGWRRLDTDETIAIDGALLAKSRRAARTVMREHADALRKLVGDVGAWWAIVDAKLAWCGGTGAFAPAAFLPPRTARALHALARGPMAGVAARAAIAWVGDPPALERALAWLAAHADAVATHGERVALQLVRLIVVGEPGKPAAIRARGVDEVIALLALDAPHPAMALAVARDLEDRLRDGPRHRRATGAPPPAAARSRPRVIAWLDQLGARDAASRHRALALVAVAGLAAAIAPWEAWERAHAALLARATELARHDFRAWDKAVHSSPLVGKLALARQHAPAAIAIADALVEIDMLATPAFIRFHGAIARLLDALPAALPPHARGRMLLHVARLAAVATPSEHLEWLWDALAAALARGASASVLAPWQAILAGGRGFLDTDLIESATRRADVEHTVRVLGALADATAEDAERVAAWRAAGLADGPLLALLPLLRGSGDKSDADTARAIVALADGSPADLAAVARALAPVLAELRWTQARAVLALAHHAARSGAAWLVRAALASGQAAALVEAASVLQLIPKPKWPPFARPPEPGGARWIARYPAVLAPALRRLAAVDPDAERAAARRLATDLPDPAALRAEIAVLRARPGAAPAKRLANLEARLAAPVLPSPVRLARLAGKLDRAAREIGLQRFTAAITALATNRLVAAFALPAVPAWSVARRTREAVFELMKLDAPADRELAGRLLRARSGPPPWDLRDDPKNRAFLAAMRAAGVDPEPWLDDAPHVVVPPAGGEPLVLALCSDPLEVFAMGAHFETCLSPDGSNFFSVLANAADVNKRVLYARRGERVVGRCLFALTDGFALLVFQPYCHEGIGFPTMVRDHALALAARMHTTLVPRGAVRTLVARDWYDDGPRDLVGRFHGLDEAFDFDAIAPADLIDRLRAALGRELDDVTLPLVLAHRGLHRRARLLPPLVPYILASTLASTRIAAAELALEAGEPALADRLLGDHAGAISIEHHAWHAGELLARLRPSVALARLRASRPRSVRTWRDEPADRVALAGAAFEALHRPRQAAALYRLAMRESWLAGVMRARLAALGEQVE